MPDQKTKRLNANKPRSKAVYARCLRPAVWVLDRYTAQQGHAAAHQTCLAHLARDVAYAVETSDDPVPWRLQLWLRSVFALPERVTDLATSTLLARHRSLDRQLTAILTTPSR